MSIMSILAGLLSMGYLIASFCTEDPAEDHRRYQMALLWLIVSMLERRS